MTSSPDTPRSTERRSSRRVTFPALLRPQLRTPFTTHPVVDASLTGLLLLHTSPARPQVGQVIRGTLEWARGEPPLTLEGTVVRVGPADVALSFRKGTIPFGYLPTS